MSTPFYVSPEQLMKDRADFARKGIARGRSVVVLQFADGVLLVAENPSPTLHKIAEIYDRIGFAAVGKYNEFENLRHAGVRYADLRGYSYDRRDVTGRGLANAYAQTLGTIFSSGGEKPYEVEIFVAEVGEGRADDQIYRLTYDGQVADQDGFAVMGGAADTVTSHLAEHYTAGASLADALRTAVAALGHTVDEKGEAHDRVIPVTDLEVAVLDRTRSQPRKFKRIAPTALSDLLGDRGPEESAPPVEEDATAGSGETAPDTDDPADPTDQVSGGTPPLENPVTGEPAPVAPPVSPPPPRPTPTDPTQPPRASAAARRPRPAAAGSDPVRVRSRRNRAVRARSGGRAIARLPTAHRPPRPGRVVRAVG